MPGFGDSYITQSESDQIIEIMRIKTDGLWNVVFYDEEPPEGSDAANVNSGGGFGDLGGSRRLQSDSTIAWPKYDNLQPEQKKILHKAGLELMGNEYFGAYLIGQNVGSDAIQKKIDENSLKFISANSAIENVPESKIGNFASIIRMDQTLLEQTEYDLIIERANVMLPSLFQDTLDGTKTGA